MFRLSATLTAGKPSRGG